MISVSLPRGLDSSQFDHRLAARFFERHTQSNIVFNVQLEMALDLIFEFPVLLLLVEQAAESHNPFTKSSHWDASLMTKCDHWIDLGCASSGNQTKATNPSSNATPANVPGSVVPT